MPNFQGELTDEELWGRPAAPAGQLSDEDVWGQPAPQRPGLGERFRLNAREGFRGTLLGERVTDFEQGGPALRAADDARRAAEEARRAGSPVGLETYADGQPSPYGQMPLDQIEAVQAQGRQIGEPAREAGVQAEAQRRAEYEALPGFSGFGEGAAAFVGQIVGAAGSPENVVGPGAASVVRRAGESAARHLGRKAVVAGAQQAPLGAVGDVAVQASQIDRGARQEYDPWETAFSAAAAGLLGGAIEITPHAVKTVRDVFAKAEGVAPEVAKVPTPEQMQAAFADPNIRGVLEANGVFDTSDPRYAAALERVGARRQAEAGRPQDPVTDADYAAAQSGASDAGRARAIGRASDELTPEQLTEYRATGEQPAPLPEAMPVEIVRAWDQEFAARPVEGMPDVQVDRNAMPAMPLAEGARPVARGAAMPELPIEALGRIDTASSPSGRLGEPQSGLIAGPRDRPIVSRPPPGAAAPAAARRQEADLGAVPEQSGATPVNRYVTVDGGQPRRFADERQAVNYVRTQTQKIPERKLEVVDHPSGRGWAVQEQAPVTQSAGGATGAGLRGGRPQAVAPPPSAPAPSVAGGDWAGGRPPPLARVPAPQVSGTPGVPAPPGGGRAVGFSSGELPAAPLRVPRQAGQGSTVPRGQPEQGMPGAAAPEAPPATPKVSRETRALDAQEAAPQGQGSVSRLPVDRPPDVADGASTAVPEMRAAEAGGAPGGASGGGSVRLAAGVDPGDVGRLIGKPLVNTIKREVSATAADITSLRRVFKSGASFRPLRATKNVIAYLGFSNRGVGRMIQRRYQGEANRIIGELMDKIATDPGSGRLVRQTYEEAVNQQVFSLTNRMGNIASGRLTDEKFAAEVGDILAGRTKAGSDEASKVAQRLRALLEEAHRYMVKAGVEVGYQKDYFPRQLDGEKVRKDKAGFLRDAQELYRKMGLSDDDAKAAADDWLDRELGVGATRFALQGPASRLTKGRTLPPEADKAMASWYIRDAFEALSSYFRQAARIAESTRRFGKNLRDIDDDMDKLVKLGVADGDRWMLRSAIDSSLGLMNGTAHTPMGSAVSWMQTIGILRALPRAVWSSIAEPMAIAVRTGNTLDGLRAFGLTAREAFGSGGSAAREVAEFAGVVGDAMTQMVLNAQFGGGQASRFNNALLGRFFQRSGLHGLTEAQRVAAVRIGQDFIVRLIRDRSQAAKSLLQDLGISDTDLPGLTEFLSRANGAPRVQDLLGNGPEARLYTAAIARFVDESIQNPKAVDRPALANHPVGRMAYGIMSFMYAYTRNVTLRVANQTTRALTERGLTLTDRARLAAGPGLALLTLSALQMGMAKARDEITNPDEAKQRPEELSALQYLSRAGAFGNFDPLVNMWLGVKYERDLTALLAGPYIGQYLQDAMKVVGLTPEPFGKNSPNTNTAEWNASRAAYNAIAVPAIAAGLSLAPGGPILSKGYGALIASPAASFTGPLGAPLAPQTASDFATAVAGPRPKRWTKAKEKGRFESSCMKSTRFKERP